MWSAIASVTSGLTLIAFVVAVVGWVRIKGFERDKALVQRAPAADQVDVLDRFAGRFHVSTDALSPDQKYRLVIEQLRLQTARFHSLLRAALIAAAMLVVLTAFGMWMKPPVPSPDHSRLPETELRFKVTLDKYEREIGGDQNAYLAVRWRFHPVVRSNLEKVSILGGRAKVYDYAQFLKDSSPDPQTTDCEATPSCIARNNWLWIEHPMLIRGGDDANSDTYMGSIKLPNDPNQKLLLWWEFVQMEGENGSVCKLDSKRRAPEGHFPFVNLVNSEGVSLGPRCYSTSGREAVGPFASGGKS